jgi:hypothetical protein
MKLLTTAAVLSALFLERATSFTPSSFLSSPYSSVNRNVVVGSSSSHQSSSPRCKASNLFSSVGISGQCLLTPEGFGFSSSAERVLSQAKRGNNGFYKASSNDKVIDVMGGMTNGPEDVALVYEAGQLVGIFTETDYLDVSS